MLPSQFPTVGNEPWPVSWAEYVILVIVFLALPGTIFGIWVSNKFIRKRWEDR